MSSIDTHDVFPTLAPTEAPTDTANQRTLSFLALGLIFTAVVICIRLIYIFCKWKTREKSITTKIEPNLVHQDRNEDEIIDDLPSDLKNVQKIDIAALNDQTIHNSNDDYSHNIEEKLGQDDVKDDQIFADAEEIYKTVIEPAQQAQRGRARGLGLVEHEHNVAL